MLKLRWKIFLAMGLVVGGLLLATLIVANRQISLSSDQAIRVELANTRKVFEGLLKEKSISLAATRRVVADGPQFKQALEGVQDPATIKDLALEFKESLGLELVVVASRKGALLANLEGVKAPDLPKPAKNAKAADSYFERAVNGAKLEEISGVWASDETVYETVTGPVIQQNSILGALRLGFAMDDRFAGALRDQTGSEVSVVSAGKIYASSLPLEARAELSRAMSSMASMAEIFAVDLAGIPYLGQWISLIGPDKKEAAKVLQLRSKSRVLQLLSQIKRNFLGILLSGLALALIIAFFVSRGVTKPLDKLIAGTRAVENGNLDFQIEVTSRDELGDLADSFNEMVRDLKEKERVKGLFGKYLPKSVADQVMALQGELKLGGEQKEVAILFSDIRGFTSISERMSPPELVSMLNDYYTRMIAILTVNDGTLDKIIGDAVMAVFGAPVNDSDASNKAIKTALEMQQAMKAFNDERHAQGQETFEIGIGINTGVVVAGNIGSTQQFSYTVIGDEVNLASRMCSTAKKGQVIVTEATFRKTKWQFEFNRLEPVTVKNVSQPVQIYEALGVKADAQPKV